MTSYPKFGDSIVGRPYLPPMASIGGGTVQDTYRSIGHTLTADGRYFSVGGEREISVGSGLFVHQGVPSGIEYDWGSSNWTSGPDMVGRGGSGVDGRFYPTLTRLDNGDMLATAGWDQPCAPSSTTCVGTVNCSVERFNVSTNSWSVVSPSR